MSSEKFPTHAHPSFQAFSIAANGPGPSADLAIDRRQLQQHDVASTQALVDHTPAGEKDDIPLYAHSIILHSWSNDRQGRDLPRR